MMKYALYKNHLTQGENDYVAIPQSTENLKIEDIISQITKPGSILKQTECVAVIHDFFNAVATNLEQGKGFVSEYIRVQPNLSGVFEGQDDQFDDARHNRQISVNAAAVFKNAISRLRLEKVLPGTRKPEIKSVYDLKSASYDAVLSPGHMIEIKGARLKFHAEQADEGVFLVHSADSKETKIDRIHRNFPKVVSGMLPDTLAQGSYTIEIRVRKKGAKQLQTSVYATELIVK